MSHIVDDIQKFRNLLKTTSKPLNESVEATGSLSEKDSKAFMDDIVVEDDDLEETDSSATQAITPLYQKVQGLVPSFKEPIRTHLLQAQKSLRAAIDASQGNQVNEEEINEGKQVEIIGYDSGVGPQLDQAAKDPKFHRKVNVVAMEFGSNGQPVLKFNELDGDGPFKAEWDPRYGWHADFSQ